MDTLKAKKTKWYDSAEYRTNKRLNCTGDEDEPEAYWYWQSRYFPLKYCYTLIKEQEASSLTAYTHIVVRRPDVILSKPFKIQDFPDLSNDYPVVLAPAFHYKACLFCDLYMVMTRSAAFTFLAVHDSYQVCNQLVFDLEGETCGNGDDSCPTFLSNM